MNICPKDPPKGEIYLLVSTSHIHAYYNGTLGKTPYIITGGAGAPLINSTPEHSFYHYILITITNNGVK